MLDAFFLVNTIIFLKEIREDILVDDKKRGVTYYTKQQFNLFDFCCLFIYSLSFMYYIIVMPGCRKSVDRCSKIISNHALHVIR